MLSKNVKPKTKYELIAALQKAVFKSFEIFEESEIDKIPSKAQLVQSGATILIIT